MQSVLFLGYGSDRTRLIEVIGKTCAVEQTSETVSADIVARYDLVVSFGYRHIISRNVLNACRRPPVNLHVSYLPYNRGAHPQFWAFYDGTPLGVTVHEIDGGIDTGPIIAQRRVVFEDLSRPFTEAYDLHFREIEALFVEWWPAILGHSYTARPQRGIGTFHQLSDLPEWPGGWEKPIAKTIAQLKR